MVPCGGGGCAGLAADWLFVVGVPAAAAAGLAALAGVACVPAGLGAGTGGGTGPPPLLIATERASVWICGRVCDAARASGV